MIQATENSDYIAVFWQNLPISPFEGLENKSSAKEIALFRNFETRLSLPVDSEKYVYTDLSIGEFPDLWKVPLKSASTHQDIIETDINATPSNQLLSPLATLISLYHIDNSDLLQYLNDNQYLVDILLSAYKVVCSFFGSGTRLDLLIREDHEGGLTTLLAYINTALTPEEALVLLDKFDEDWFIGILPSTNNRLNFQLKYNAI